MTHETEKGLEPCSDCPPNGYPTDKTRCAPCPRRVTPLTALRRSKEGWDNAIEFGLIPPQHRNSAKILSDGCAEAIAALTRTTPLPDGGDVEAVARAISEAGGATNWEHALAVARAALAAMPLRTTAGEVAVPVAWRYTRYDGQYLIYAEQDHKKLPPWTDEGVWTETPLYATPPAPKDGEVERLREALQPFAIEASDYDDGDGDPDYRGAPDKSSLNEVTDLTVGDLRRAREVWRSLPFTLNEREG